MRTILTYALAVIAATFIWGLGVAVYWAVRSGISLRDPRIVAGGMGEFFVGVLSALPMVVVLAAPLWAVVRLVLRLTIGDARGPWLLALGLATVSVVDIASIVAGAAIEPEGTLPDLSITLVRWAPVIVATGLAWGAIFWLGAKRPPSTTAAG